MHQLTYTKLTRTVTTQSTELQDFQEKLAICPTPLRQTLQIHSLILAVL